MTETAASRCTGAEQEPTDDTAVSPETVIALLSDEYARAFLRAVRTEAKSARELAEECGTSRSTAYRRLDRLREAGLVVEHLACEPGGHHRRTFVATVESVGVELGESGFETEVEVCDPPAPTHG
ncbi:MAG: putative transcriptional regulator [Natronomonas sp.]|jgi:predicted transcriptional regulator